MTDVRHEAEVLPTSGHYIGAVTRWKSGMFPRVVATCGHHHRSRDVAERCAARLLAKNPAP